MKGVRKRSKPMRRAGSPLKLAVVGITALIFVPVLALTLIYALAILLPW